MSNIGDSPTRVNPNPQTAGPEDFFKQVLDMQTGSSILDAEGLKAIDELMRDPLQESLAVLFAALDRDDPSHPNDPNLGRWVV